MPDGGIVAYHAVISGRVQGVGFRYSASRVAVKLQLRGWVRNSSDGTVLVHCEGEPGQVTKFLKWLESGPPGAFVRQVEKRQVRPLGTYRSFSVEY